MKIKPYLILLALSSCWSPSYLFIRIAVRNLGPLTLAAARLFIAFCILYTICNLKGHKLWEYKHLWKRFLFMAVFFNVISFVLINYAEQHVSSGLTAILMGTIPIYTAILAHFTTDDRLSVRKVISIALALSGVIIVYIPQLFSTNDNYTLGILLLTVAAVSYAIATVYAKTHLTGLPPLIAPTAQTLVSALILIPLALIFDRHNVLTLETVGATVALGVIGTALAFYLYYELLRIKGPTFLSLNSLIVPILAVILGWIVLGEKFGWNVYLGGCLIILGIALTSPYFRIHKS